MPFEVFPYTNFHELNLDWLIKEWKDTKNILNVELSDLQDLKEYINNYFDNLDVQEEINNKIDEMYNNGELQNLLTKINSGVAIYLGNSYTDGTEGINGLYARTRNWFVTTYKKTASGAGFGVYTGHATTFDMLLQAQANEMTESERNEVTHIICISAIGDTRYLREHPDINSFIANVRNTYTVMNTYFPNAKMHIFFAGAQKGWDAYAESLTNYNNDVYTHYLFQFAVKQIPKCIYYGWIGWDLEHRSNLFMTDGYHPNETGYQFLTSNMLNALKGVFEYQAKEMNVTTTNGTVACHITSLPFKTTITPARSLSDLSITTSDADFIDMSNALCCPVDQNSFTYACSANGNTMSVVLLRVRKGKLKISSILPVTITDHYYNFPNPIILDSMPSDNFVNY